jgi:hypothetical protein
MKCIKIGVLCMPLQDKDLTKVEVTSYECLHTVEGSQNVVQGMQVASKFIIFLTSLNQFFIHPLGKHPCEE